MREWRFVVVVGAVRSFEIRPDDVNEIGGALGFFGILLVNRIDNVVPDVIFEQFRGQPCNCAANRGDEHRGARTADFRLKGTVNGVDLVADVTDVEPV